MISRLPPALFFLVLRTPVSSVHRGLGKIHEPERSSAGPNELASLAHRPGEDWSKLYAHTHARSLVHNRGVFIELPLFAATCRAHSWRRVHTQSLQEKFRDPTSPYHIPPGTQGPESPDPPAEETELLSPAEEGRAKLLKLGFDPDSFWEQKVVWGDHDSFQCVLFPSPCKPV